MYGAARPAILPPCHLLSSLASIRMFHSSGKYKFTIPLGIHRWLATLILAPKSKTESRPPLPAPK